ncbi:MAG: cell wall hydrolase [Alphaproteobacteria bacterium]|jgi:N-acetylmuramoyl-L-alanine amidase|nr:cell wall hydrolase [Alphaproteobacteria bacterium]
MKSDKDIDLLARTIYGEARGEFNGKAGLASLIAVGNVVMNRVRLKGWFGHTIQEVCHKPWQFSCWNEQDPNRLILLQKEILDPVFFICRDVANKVFRQEWPDLTKGSDHYHATTMSLYPKWSKGIPPKVCIGKHVFYQLMKGD